MFLQFADQPAVRVSDLSITSWASFDGSDIDSYNPTSQHHEMQTAFERGRLFLRLNMSSNEGFYIYGQLLSHNEITPKLREEQAVNFYYRNEFRTCIIKILSRIEVLSDAVLLDAVILLPWGKLDDLWITIQVGDEFSLNDLHRVLAEGEVLEVFDA